ncbi:MAG: hypothetical protein JXA71_06855 [Chitinispirillaceae bacterium]|nr:hypothetical protein [Chitinispirillaceae bacterium]
MLYVKINAVASRFRKMLRGAIACCLGMAFFFLGFAGSYNGPNPSLHQIDSLWRALYGSPVHQGIVVYNKTTGGTSNTSLDTVCIMRLVSASNAATVKSLFYFRQWQTSGWGASSAYRISPDGSKIALFNNTAVEVCDTSGANVKVIKSVYLGFDQLAVCWDDSAGIRRLVYSIGSIIVRTVINENNTAGKTDTLWSNAWGKDPASGNNIVYTSVNKSGHFISFDMQNTTYGVNLPVVADLSSLTAICPTNGGDGCQVRMIMDGSGTVSYHEWTHLTGTTLWRWPSTKLGSVPCPGGAQTNCTDCGNNMYYWCDSDTNYMVQTGDNDQGVSPGCYTKAFIRKGKAASFAATMYLGDYFAFPALWIDPQPFTPVGTLDRPVPSSGKHRVTVTLAGRELTLSGAGVDKVSVYGLNGAVVARGERNDGCGVHLSLASLRAGTYLLVWRQGSGTGSRYVAIPR